MGGLVILFAITIASGMFYPCACIRTVLTRLKPNRTVVLKSTCAAGAGFNAAPVVINEQRVVGSRCGPFDTALRLLASPGGIDVERYISGDTYLPTPGYGEVSLPFFVFAFIFSLFH